MIIDMGFSPARAFPVLSATGALLLFLAATHRHGLGLSLDSVVYTTAARSAVERGTLDVPLTWWDAEQSQEPLSHFPPALPLALAAISGSTGASPWLAARWLNAACLFATVLLAFSPIAESTFALVVMAALLAAPSFATMYLWLWSEPLFLLIALVALRRGVAIQARGATTARVVLLGVACGLATLTRYAGVSLFAGFGLVLVLSTDRFARRLGRLLCYGGAYFLTISPWIYWLAVTGGAPRSLGIYTEHAWPQVVLPLARTIIAWFLPASCPLPVGIVLVAVVLSLAIRAYLGRQRSGDEGRLGATLYVSGILIVVNVTFLVAARLFADAGIPMDERILSTAMLFFAVAASDVAKALFPGGLPVVPAVLSACVALSNVGATVPWVARLVRDGLGYSSERWRDSETLAWLRTAPPNLTIFSNAPDIICAWLPVTAKYTPRHYEADRLAALAGRVERSAPAVVVLFDDPHAGWLLPRDRLKDLPFSHDVRVFPDSVVLLSRTPGRGSSSTL